MLPEKWVDEDAEHAREAGLAPATSSEAVLRLSVVVQPNPVAEPAPLLLTTVSSEPEPPSAAQVWNGPALRRAREVRGVTLAKLSEVTKVARQHLESIEGDRYDRLPSYVYLRGILVTVARELRLDEQLVCRSYLDTARQATSPAP